MTISAALLPEFDNEMSTTRKTLERVPEELFGWKPHEKSGTMGWLATHVANLPEWGVNTISKESLDLAPEGQSVGPLPTAKSSRELLEAFDKGVKETRAALAGATDEELMKTWKLLMSGKELFAMPRAAVWRTFVMNHLIHHRAQLGVYLRLNDIPVPATYGPSADENPMF
jgi:uncharacterized damage-inducible protein DinB